MIQTVNYLQISAKPNAPTNADPRTTGVGNNLPALLNIVNKNKITILMEYRLGPLILLSLRL